MSTVITELTQSTAELGTLDIPGLFPATPDDKGVDGSLGLRRVPIRRLIPYADLLRFDGCSPDLYYVYESDTTLANTTSDINESLRQVVQIGAQGAKQ